jgi:protoheme IX farnesyltransferase
LGIAYLWIFTHPGMVAVAVVSWIIYVWVYTPLKIFTPWQTPIGAVAGAMPVLLGATAARAPMSPTSMTLFGLVFFWQFPHAMAIAWLYRDQFAEADSKVATVVDPSGRTAAALSVVGALALIPVSLVPVFTESAGWLYGTFAILIGLGYFIPSVRFLLQVNDRNAKAMLRASFVYLPAVLAALVVARLV